MIINNNINRYDNNNSYKNILKKLKKLTLCLIHNTSTVKIINKKVLICSVQNISTKYQSYFLIR